LFGRKCACFAENVQKIVSQKMCFRNEQHTCTTPTPIGRLLSSGNFQMFLNSTMILHFAPARDIFRNSKTRSEFLNVLRKCNQPSRNEFNQSN